MNEKTVLEIPYGLADFTLMRRKSRCYYVDRTNYIPVIERASRFLFLIRPRRFGKSLLLSMLHCYYDVLERDNFEATFQDTWILDHPTPERHAYLVMALNFAAVDPAVERVEASFEEYLDLKIRSFCRRYASLLGEATPAEVNRRETASAKLNALF